VRMSPPLVVTEDEADTAVRIFTESVAHVALHRGEDVAEMLAGIEHGYAAAATGEG